MTIGEILEYIKWQLEEDQRAYEKLYDENEHLKMLVECLLNKDKPKDKMIEKLLLENKQLQERINKSIRKLNSALNHYKDEHYDLALRFTLAILKGE